MSKLDHIKISNARLRYAAELLFDNLNLSLRLNAWTCLLGPSGVGKSSLLNLLAGLTSITDQDELSADIPEHSWIQTQIAYMGQQDGLLPWLTVLDNICIGSRLREEKIDLAKAEALIAKLGLQAASKKYPHQLSGGMRQRTALARTLYEDKAIVLMDEPFSALDAITRLRLQELAVEFLRNKTVLLVTHDPLEALRVGDEIYVMSGKPASLNAALRPAGLAPRNLTDPEILKLQGALLSDLEAAVFE